MDRPIRFAAFVSAVPVGRVVTFRQVVTGMGAANSYLRAIPGYIRQNTDPSLALHRIVDSYGRLIKRYLPGQAEALRDEGIRVRVTATARDDDGEAAVDLDAYSWRDPGLFTRPPGVGTRALGDRPRPPDAPPVG